MHEPRSVDVAFDDAKIAAGLGAELGPEVGGELPLVGGRYRLLERLGEGSFGSVYRAQDLELDRHVALKTLALDEEAKSGREGRALARLTHPNVVRIYNHGVAEDYWYLVLEILEGQHLAAWLAAEKRSPAAIVEVFLEAGRGLAAAHSAGLVHRDFKPSNVMVTTDGRVVVVDFGQARGLDTDDSGEGQRSRSGTLAYMAPERLAGEVGDARSDQFSFCVALWEALAGDNPFSGDDVDERFASIMCGPRRPLVGGALGRVLGRGLSRLRGERYPSMVELLAELERSTAPRGRRSFLFAAAVAAAVLLGVGLLPEGPTLDESVADAERGELTVDELLDLAEHHARAGHAGRAMDSLEKAQRLADEDTEAELRCADRAMIIGEVLLEGGHRAAAASAFLVAEKAYSKHGLEGLARWAAEQASVAAWPTPGR